MCVYTCVYIYTFSGLLLFFFLFLSVLFLSTIPIYIYTHIWTLLYIYTHTELSPLQARRSNVSSGHCLQVRGMRVFTAVWLLSHAKLPPCGDFLVDASKFAMAYSSPLASGFRSNILCYLFCYYRITCSWKEPLRNQHVLFFLPGCFKAQAQYASRLCQSPPKARAGSECNATFPMCLDIFGGLWFRVGHKVGFWLLRTCNAKLLKQSVSPCRPVGNHPCNILHPTDL